ncbi:MAG: YHS domain-containing protein, partial [Nitriliruptoraceae bacterium]
MHRPARLTSSLALVAMTATAFAAASTGTPAVAAPDALCVAPQAQAFDMGYIDTTRAGGEPIITRHPDGQLLWGSHAGTTHFYSPSAASPTSTAFAENYEGQTYYYVSDDDNEAWDFVPRTPVSGLGVVVGAPATGFSDPEFAIDKNGTVYVSEINLANIAVSKSIDGGRSYELV